MTLSSSMRFNPGGNSSATARAASARSHLAHLLRLEGGPPSRCRHLAPKPPHFKPSAKNVIFLFMEGAPSQMDLFDPKPELQQWNGKPLPHSRDEGSEAGVHQAHRSVLGSPSKFQQHGQCGMELSELLPHIGYVRRRHLPGPLDAQRGVQSSSRPVVPVHGTHECGRPTMGAWVTYGLGQRVAEPARIRRADFGSRHQRGLGQLVERLPAFNLCRARHSAARAIRFSIFRIRRGLTATSSARASI